MDVSLLDQIIDKVSNLEGLAAYGTIFGVLFGCGLGVPIPEDLTIITAGYLAYLDNISLPWAIVVCIAGVLTGDLLLFSLGRIFGKHFFDLPAVRLIATPERVAYAQAKLKKNARRVCFTARFIAGVRAPVYLSAGMLGIRPGLFIMIDFSAALISVPLLTYMGYYFGDELDIALGYIRRAEHYILIGLSVVGVYFLFNIIRRRLQGGDIEGTSKR